MLDAFTHAAIPYTNDDGLRDYRASVARIVRHRRWPLLVLLAFLLGFFFGVKTAHGAERCVQLQVRPHAMIRRGDIRIETRVCRQPEHRALLLQWDSDRAGAGSSLTPLEGADAPSLFTRWLPNQPPANYQFDAAVYDSRGAIVGRDRAQILSIDGPE